VSSPFTHFSLDRRSPHYWRVTFDHEAIAQTKWYVDQVTLPPDAELPPALHDFFDSLGRPGTIARSRRLADLGLNSDSDLERYLGKRVVESGEGVPA
jgi:hypothetical protein